MTIINTQYSTLEEAWGVENLKQPRKTSKRQCDLYENRNKPKSRPFRHNSKNEVSQDMMILGDKNNPDYDKYYGYADAKPSPRKQTRSHSDESTARKYNRHIAVNPKSNTYSNEDQRIYEEGGDMIYEEVYDEDDDNYLSIDQQNMNMNNLVEDEVDNEINEEVDDDEYDVRKISQTRNPENQMQLKQGNKQGKQNQQQNQQYNLQNLQNTQIVDLAMYTLSGIILIFMMEQFVQLGIKIKTYT